MLDCLRIAGEEFGGGWFSNRGLIGGQFDRHPVLTKSFGRTVQVSDPSVPTRDIGRGPLQSKGDRLADEAMQVAVLLTAHLVDRVFATLFRGIDQQVRSHVPRQRGSAFARQ